MVMKSANFIFLFLVVVILPSLNGCASNNRDNIGLSLDKDKPAQLLDSAKYIPEPKFDENGVQLFYERKENPYLSKKGKIKKSSVELYIEARRAFNQGDYTLAGSLLDKLIEQDDSLSGPWVMKGDAALQQNETQKAFDNYIAALKVNRDNINAYLRLAKVQRLQGAFVHAQNTYVKILSLWPDCPEAHLNLGVLYDVYLNHPLRAQKHMEAYQFLTDGKNQEVAKWLQELQQRTGVEFSLGILKADVIKPLS